MNPKSSVPSHKLGSRELGTVRNCDMVRLNFKEKFDWLQNYIAYDIFWHTRPTIRYGNTVVFFLYCTVLFPEA